MLAQGSSVKGSSQQSSTSFPKVKGGGPLFSGPGPLITGGLVNDTTPEPSWQTFYGFTEEPRKSTTEISEPCRATLTGFRLAPGVSPAFEFD